jgi:hypothetical protein
MYGLVDSDDEVESESESRHRTTSVRRTIKTEHGDVEVHPKYSAYLGARGITTEEGNIRVTSTATLRHIYDRGAWGNLKEVFFPTPLPKLPSKKKK